MSSTTLPDRSQGTNGTKLKSLDAVQKSLDSVTSDSKNGIAGIVFTAIDKNGEYLTANASGNKGLATNKPMDLDTVFWIASCTKILATMVCMQLIEQGKLSLDDHKSLYKLCPELEKVKVLQNGKLVDKTKDITLRMLLNHTAGFGYEFFNHALRDYGRPIGYDCFSGNIDEILSMPLVNQPGSRWEYGINIDWAGIAAERATGQSLNELMQKNILEPLGLENINMIPTASMKSNLATMHQRWPGSSLPAEERDHCLRNGLLASTPEQKAAVFCSGGAGAFAKPTEYVRVLAVFLNDGKDPRSGKQILTKESVDEMFKNQIPEFPDFARNSPLGQAKSEHTNEAPELYPQEGNPPQGWGLSWMLTIEPGATGRGRNTAWWAGIANLFYWVDREKGVAGMIASQVMPFGDPGVMGQWGACEAAVYASLK